jgi:hypothetical protein
LAKGVREASSHCSSSSEQNHGHAVVNRPHQLIRFSRNDGEAFHFAALRFAPHVPQSREGERLLTLVMDPHRDLALPFFAPLIETVSGNNTAAAIDEMLEGR